MLRRGHKWIISMFHMDYEAFKENSLLYTECLETYLQFLSKQLCGFLEYRSKLSYRDKRGNGGYWPLRTVCLAGGQEGLGKQVYWSSENHVLHYIVMKHGHNMKELRGLRGPRMLIQTQLTLCPVPSQVLWEIKISTIQFSST